MSDWRKRLNAETDFTLIGPLEMETRMAVDTAQYQAGTAEFGHAVTPQELTDILASIPADAWKRFHEKAGT